MKIILEHNSETEKNTEKNLNKIVTKYKNIPSIDQIFISDKPGNKVLCTKYNTSDYELLCAYLAIVFNDKHKDITIPKKFSSTDSIKQYGIKIHSYPILIANGFRPMLWFGNEKKDPLNKYILDNYIQLQLP